MYQLERSEEWDTDYFHTLMGEKRIISSKEAKDIRDKLIDAGALPPLDNNFDWAMLCIGYCFAKGLAESSHRLIPAPTGKGGVEIPSFQTCFQDYSRLWLALLSETLFRLNPGKAVTKDDLYALIQSLWHTGAVELDKFWEGCKSFKSDSDLEARQAFLNELTVLAVKNAGCGAGSDGMTTDEKATPDAALSQPDPGRLKDALEQSGIRVKEIEFIEHGLRYDYYRVQFASYVDLERHHDRICSELGMDTNSLRSENYTGIPNCRKIKILRSEHTWKNYGDAEFQTALQSYNGNFILPVCIGVSETGEAQFADFAAAPHAIVAGESGSGKSVFVRAALHSLCRLNSADKFELMILDPKQVDYQGEFEHYPHLYNSTVIADTAEMFEILTATVEEMESRYRLMAKNGAKKIAELPESIRPKYRVIMVEELADLLDEQKDAEIPIVRLAQKARAAGIFLFLATQRPDSKTLSGRLRDNLPTKIVFKVSKHQSSTIILGETGAEKLQKGGDHLVKWNGEGETQFLHGYLV